MNQTTAKPNPINMDAKQITIEMQRLYVKEQSCKVPHGYQAFQNKDAKLEAQTEMAINNQPIGPDVYEITLNISVTGRAEQSTAYTANVQQACVIKTPNRDEETLKHLTHVYVPNLIYPYVRKAIADLTANTGFPPVFLPLVDFAAMYQQQLSNEKNNQVNSNNISSTAADHMPAGVE